MGSESSQELASKSGAVASFARRPENPFWKRKQYWWGLGLLLLVVAIALAVGLGVGLTRAKASGAAAPATAQPSASATPSSPSPSPSPSPGGNTTNPNATSTTPPWQPAVGATWQIVLEHALNDSTPDVTIYDIDLFTNPSTTMAALHALNRKVICYFSAGSYEDFRPDSHLFQPSDYGKPLDGWPGEHWLDIRSTNVRSIMLARLDLAEQKGCDGVDPDNIDGYDNDTGLDLRSTDAIDYLSFLANAAHSRHLSIGLKNAGDIVNATLPLMQWEVNEQCVQFDECEAFRPFLAAGKPVFHIEYPDQAPVVSAAAKSSICQEQDARGFSTLLKELNLGNWLETC